MPNFQLDIQQKTKEENQDVLIKSGLSKLRLDTNFCVSIGPIYAIFSILIHVT